MIKTVAITKTYGNRAVVDGLSLDVQPGEILGLLGVNGAGKSTTSRMIAGLVTPTSGRIFVNDHDMVNAPLRAKAQLGYVPETPALYDSLTADSFLDIICALHHLDPALAERRRRRLLELVDLREAQHQPMGALSKGMRQKVSILGALIHDPSVLVLDEPFDGLDPNMCSVMKTLLSDFAANGKTILFSSHIMEVVELLCTRICVMDEGRVVAAGTADDIRRQLGQESLSQAFAALTGAPSTDQVKADILSALAG